MTTEISDPEELYDLVDCLEPIVIPIEGKKEEVIPFIGQNYSMVFPTNEGVELYSDPWTQIVIGVIWDKKVKIWSTNCNLYSLGDYYKICLKGLKILQEVKEFNDNTLANCFYTAKGEMVINEDGTFTNLEKEEIYTLKTNWNWRFLIIVIVIAIILLIKYYNPSFK